MIHVHDLAPASHDPTGTTMLRRRFVADARRRWASLAVLTRDAILKHGMLGSPTVQSIGLSASLPRGDLFAHWFGEAMRQTVLNGDGGWLGPYIETAAGMARKRAAGLVGGGGVVSLPQPGPVPTLISVTVSELRGITEAVAQQVARAVGHGTLSRDKPPQLANAIVGLIKSIGVSRTNAMINYMVVKAFAAVTIEEFRAAGIQRVGTQAERVPKPKPALDALFDKARVNPQRRHPRTGKFIPFTRAPSRARRAEIERAQKRLSGLGEVAVETAEDDDVCPRCEKISEDGPYDIDDVLSLIPNHVNCRCVLVPTRDEGGRFQRRAA